MSITQPKGKIKFIDHDKRMFFATLKNRVDQYFKDRGISSHANTKMVVKTIVLLTVYILPFLTLLFVPMSAGISLLLWLLMGLGVAGIGMSVMHDANHGAYSEHAGVNTFIGYTLNMLGAAVSNWKLQHNLLHHTYTNITYMDDDIDDKGVLRFSPHTEVKGIHRYQWLYAFAFYGITTLYWVLLKDFVQFVRYTRNGVNVRSKSENRMTMIRIIAVKVIYLAITIGLPIWAGHAWVAVLGGFLLMHFTAGVILTVVFQLAHTVEGTSHPMPSADGSIENEWAIHQLNTTVDFAPKNKWLSWYVGGLNFQVEHHLFPRVCHVHYPDIAPIVQQTAEEFNVPYLVNQTFSQALHSHIATLRRFGRLPSMDEAIG